MERSANYPSLFHILQLKNSAFPRIAKLSFVRIVQQMCTRFIAASGVLQSMGLIKALPLHDTIRYVLQSIPYSLWSICQRMVIFLQFAVATNRRDDRIV